MLPKPFRLFLILACGVSGAVVFFFDYWLSLALWIAALILILMHFRYGSIVLVLRALGKGDVDKAEMMLNDIKRPDWLAKSYQAYYQFARGLIAYRRGEVEAGKDAFLMAIQIGLPGKYEKSISYLNLAHATYRENNKAQTLDYLQKARDNQNDDLFLKQRIEELEKATEQMKGE